MENYKFILNSIVCLMLVQTFILSKNQLAISQPAPIFQPFLERIALRLPRGMVMRLPAFFEFIGTSGQVRIYPQIVNRQNGTLAVLLNTESNCQARFCQLGAISTFRNYSVESQNIINRAGDPQYRRIIPITLSPEIRGIYMKSWTGGASSVPGSAVLWEQNGQGFMISLPFSPQLTEEENKQHIIDLAVSMVNEHPIFSRLQ